MADALRAERGGQHQPDGFSGADHYQHMVQVQCIAQTYELELYELSRKYRRTSVKLVDDFLWWIVHRPMYQLRDMVAFEEEASR